MMTSRPNPAGGASGYALRGKKPTMETGGGYSTPASPFKPVDQGRMGKTRMVSRRNAGPRR